MKPAEAHDRFRTHHVDGFCPSLEMAGGTLAEMIFDHEMGKSKLVEI